MASFQDLICYTFMLSSTSLVLLKAHTMAYKGCVGPKSTCLYIATLGPFVYACTVLLGVGTQVFLHKRASVTMLTSVAYVLLWTTRESGPLFRRWLHSLLNFCLLYIAIGVVSICGPTDPWNLTAICTLTFIGYAMTWQDKKKINIDK
jgi:hypothetical protein